MENNENVKNQDTQTEDMGNETGQGEGTAQKDGEAQKGNAKMFTQEEVNGFVQSRVSRMKSQIEKESKAEYDSKLAELNARENKLLVREELSRRGLSQELADIITCTDEADLKNKLDKLDEIYGVIKQDAEEVAKKPRFTKSMDDGKNGNIASSIRNAMGLH